MINIEPMKNYPRYPYIHACDYIRSAADPTSLSRRDASLIRSAIASAIGMNDRLLAEKLADAQLINDKDQDLLEKQAERTLRRLGYLD